jgi:predicted secreted Zn-dependent protease
MRRRLLAGLVLLLALTGCGGLSLAAPPPTRAPPLPPAAVITTETPSLPATPGAPSNVRLVERVSRQTYLVYGSTMTELRSYLNANGPTAADDNRRYDGVTNWNLQWSMRYQRGEACSIANATIVIDIVQILPEPATPEGLSPAALARWRTFAEALALHERGHVERELAGARALKARFEAEPPAANCNELGRTLGELGEQQIAGIRSADIGYDQETMHGVSQGASFP